MNFFDYIKNEFFFKPLTLKYKKIYYDCIQILINKVKELPVLYESDAKDSITIYLKEIKVSTDQEDSGTELLSSEIISLFRECGWILPREIGRSGEYVVNISIECRRLMDFLKKMTDRMGEGMMSNRIFSMYEIVKSAFDEESMRRERPYANILIPLIDNETELKNELTDLKNSIASIMKAVIVFQDINSFGQFIMKDEMLDKFFGEYFFVKNNGLIPTQISYIKGRLRTLRTDDTYEKMINECSEKLQISYDEAMEKVDGYFSELQYFLGIEYEANMELIDTRINNYYNLANTRIMLMASNGIMLEAAINDFLNAIAKIPDYEQDETIEKISDCVRIVNQKYVGYKSFESRKRMKHEGENIGLFIDELSEKEKFERTNDLFENSKNRYSVDKVSSFLDVKFGDWDRLDIKQLDIKTKEEVLMYAAAMLYQKNEEFPYDIQLSDDLVRMDIADITDMTMIKK